MADQSLDDVFDGVEESAEDVTEQNDAAELAADDDTGTDGADDNTTGEKQAEPPAAESVKAPEHAPIAALVDERHKRQLAEQRYAELEARIAQQEAAPAVDVIEDPEGAYAALKAEFRNELWKTKAALSIASAKRLYTDFAEKEATFVEMATANPYLAQQMQASDDPAEFAYQAARKAGEFAEMQDVDVYRAKIEAEVRAKIAAETKSSGENQSSLDSALQIGSLNGARASARAGVVDDESLASVLGR